MARYYKRGFLNRREGLAAFEAEIWDVDKFEKPKGGATKAWVPESVMAELSLTDCGRKITLEFSVPTKGREDLGAFRKIDRLVAELTTLRAQLTQAVAEQRQEARKAIEWNRANATRRKG